MQADTQANAVSERQGKRERGRLGGPGGKEKGTKTKKVFRRGGGGGHCPLHHLITIILTTDETLMA